jgi:hypothetical protein
MVRQLTKPHPRGWKAVLAAFVAAGAVAWQIMACIESPMSFSPTGDLAFVVMDPYPKFEQFEEVDESFFRLMILSPERELREVERTRTHMLTAPAYGPDGSQFAYLRLPLLTAEDSQRIGAFIERRAEAEEDLKALTETSEWVLIAPMDSGASEEGVGPTDFDELSVLPSLQSTWNKLSAGVVGGGVISAELVVRETATGDVAWTVPIRIPHLGRDGNSVGASYYWAYLATRPQFSPDGLWVYFWLDGFGLAVNPSSGEKRLLHFGNAVDRDMVGHRGFLLSPDGRTIAAVDTGTLRFLATDGKRASYVSLDRAPALGGMAWARDGSLLVLAEEDDFLDRYDANGNLVHSQDLPGEPDESEGENDQFALSPDGEYMVIGYGDAVRFFTRDGQLLASWIAGNDRDLLAQPIFTPDSRQVAFKQVITEEDDEKSDNEERIRTTHIVFFTPEGQELFRVPIPPIPDDERPAPPAPATGETKQ